MRYFRILYLDMDGVLANFVDYLKQYFNKPDVHIRGFDTLAEDLGISNTELYSLYMHNPEIFLELKPYIWADNLVELAHSLANEVFVCSAALTPKIAMNKIAWLHRFFPMLCGYYPKLIFTLNKDNFATPDSLLIDDNDATVNLFREAGGNAIVFPQEWNSNAEHRDKPINFIIREIENISQT